jgi:hypothetical protein
LTEKWQCLQKTQATQESSRKLKLGERLSKNEPTHWFTIKFHEKAVGHEEAVTSLVETTQKSTQKQRAIP